MLPDPLSGGTPGVAQVESAADGVVAQAPTDMVVLGKIVGPYGLRGAVKVHPFADDPPSWSRLPYWWIGRDADAPASWRQAGLQRCRVHGDVLLAELDCLADRDAAEAVHGALVGVPRAALPKAAEGEYYWADLVGLDVRNVRGQSLGRVLGLIETPANAVLRVGNGESVEQLLPFVAAVVLDVDLEAGTVHVDWEADW